MNQVARLGRFASGADDFEDTLYPWITVTGGLAKFDPTSLRAVAAYLRFAAKWDDVALSVLDGNAILCSTSKRPGQVSEGAWNAVTSMEPWLSIQITLRERSSSNANERITRHG
jgi:hypothetical protein